MDTYNVTLYEGEDLAKAKLPLPDNIAEDLRSYLVKNDFLRKKGEGGLRFVGTFQIKTEEYCLRVCSLPKYLERKQRAEYGEACAAMVSIRKVIEKTGHRFDYAESEAEFDLLRIKHRKILHAISPHNNHIMQRFSKQGIFPENGNCLHSVHLYLCNITIKNVSDRL